MEVLSLCYYSKGGFTWSEAYTEVPVHMRRYYLNELYEIIKKENEPAKEGQTPGKASQVAKPGVLPKSGPRTRPPIIPKKK